MQTLKDSGLGGRILALLSIGFVALILSSVISLWTVERSGEQAQLIRHTYEVRATANRVLISTTQAESAQRGFLLTQQESHANLEVEARGAALQGVLRLRELVADNPSQIERLDRLQPLLEERLQLTEQTVRDSRRGMTLEAIRVVQQGRGPLLMSQVRGILDEIIEVENALIGERQDGADQLAAVSYWMTLISTVLIVLVGASCVIIFLRYLAEIQRARSDLNLANAGLERRVQERTAELVAANDEIQRFAYIVSHDLRAPLVNVMGYTSELQAAGKAIDKQLSQLEDKAPDQVLPEAVTAVREDIPEAIGFIRTSTEKMDRLINAILKLSREGRRNLTIQTLDMTSLVQAIADSVNHQTEATGAEILVEPMPGIESDRLMVEQVFGNLIDNAVKYLDPARPGRIVIRGREERDGYVHFEVEDNGRGVAGKDHERIFELFRRSGRQDRPGEGLGLAFVRSTVRRLGGTISVTSSLAEGSTFHVNLPKRLKADGVGGSDE
jgi:signal transduction histidine kinase